MGETQDLELHVFEVNNKQTGEKSFQVASNAQDACKQAGWLIGDCYVNPQRPHHKTGLDGRTIQLATIPCITCPFQYGECKKPDDVDCPVRPQAPELKEWLKQAAEAHICPYQGQELTKKDHDLGRKTIPMEQAILELTRQL